LELVKRPRRAWLVLALALVLGGWLAFDGARALIVGDYVTPATGEHAGQLGPWAGLISRIGIDPRSTLVKAVHLGLGIAFLGAAFGFLLRRPWARAALLTCAVLGLWYLPFGTIIGIVLIFVPFRSALRPWARPGNGPGPTR
jgi:hypothetical protein